VVTDKVMVTYRIAIGNDLAVLDVDVEVAVSNFNAIDELANVNVGNARCLIGVRVLADDERRVRDVLRQLEYVSARDLDGVNVHGSKAVHRDDLGDLEAGIGVDSAEAKRLAGTASGGRGGRVGECGAGKADDGEGGEEERTHIGVGGGR
jgi:hypothetical protein